MSKKPSSSQTMAMDGYQPPKIQPSRFLGGYQPLGTGEKPPLPKSLGGPSRPAPKPQGAAQNTPPAKQ